MLYKSRAIVLKSHKYGESGIIVQIYTEEFGRQSFIVHGARNRKARYSPALFNSLSLIDIDLYYKENRDIQTIKEVKPCLILHNITCDIKKSSIAIFIGEILLRTLKEVEPNKLLFSFLYHAIEVLEIAEKGIENYHLIFLFQFSKYIGIYPENYNNLRVFLSDKRIKLDNWLHYSFTQMEDIQLGRNQRQELLKSLVEYYQQNMDGIGEIKSLSILSEVFSN